MEKTKKTKSVDATKSYRGDIDKYFEQMSKEAAKKMASNGLDKKRRK